ncbi:diguanylate cyclase (GGDEF)-like protein [Allocatelliglobosispora scoriae]|uniref:Diguanylate cyclase (GGDEF)-like protein n=1 Tax=Allocatelliglobosispora scoriae TaxID=643052 RepID=A0A841BUX8_9ACTN|nr:diguanylate cyclase (GGDEF)-like protein [Allocatelliglobosispora scoriae]
MRRRTELAWLITGQLTLIAASLAAILSIRSHEPIGKWGWALVFFAVCVAADTVTLSFEVRRDTVLMSLSEIPLLLGLFVLPPITLLLVRVAASVVTQMRRKVAPVKGVFNIAKSAASTTCACLVVSALGPLKLEDPRSWLVLAAAVFTSAAINVAAVVAVIAVVQGRMTSQEIAATAIPSVIATLINITVGLVILIVLQQSGWAVLLLGFVVAVFALAYRSYAQFLRQHRTLSEIYDITRAIADTPHDGTLTDVLLSRVRTVLAAETATLWLPAQGRFPDVLLTARVDALGLLDVVATPDSIRKAAIESGETIAIGAKLGEDDRLAQLRESGVKDLIVVPLKAGSAVIGCLEVSSRMGEFTGFGPGDVRLLEAVAAHAAVAVENSRLVERLRFDAYHDALTSLPNRRRLTAALEESVKVRAPGEVVAVLLFDVDSLRDVNDSLGYAAGDRLLAEVASRLRGSAPSAALVGRSGGDEFVVTMRVANAEAAMALATTLRRQLQKPLTFGTLTLDVDTAVGIVVHPDHGTEPATLLQRAELATYAAKSSASGVQLFSLGMESRSVRRLGLAGDLRRALDNNDLEVYFQPKVDLRDRHLVGVECLARWEHPTHGSVAPEDFVAVAEHTGQLGRLTEAVLAAGLMRARQWVDAGRPLGVAVNLSPRTLVDPDFPLRVEELLQEHGVSPDRLTLEITEDGFVGEEDRPLPTLRRLYEMGVRLSVDDFGTGYSSLSYLRRLPVHEVKVDRTFVQGMATDAGDFAIVRAVVDISRHFGLAVVAEGVESELTLDLLADIGCDIGQGFLFSRPLPYERLEAWLGARTDAEPSPTGELRRLRAVG